MKKTLINATYVSFMVAFFSIITIGCKSSINETPKDFVYLEDNVFKINDTVFFPLMLNYKVDMRNADDAVVLSPFICYDNNDIYESNTKEEMQQQFSNHLELTSELGFNAVRLCIDVINKNDIGNYYPSKCGGIGFGWQEFQDHINKDMNFEANYTGLLNHEGITKTKSGNEIIGTIKPAAYKFKEFSKLKAQGPKPRPQNYYNMLGYENYVIKGKIECNNESVEGALIRGQNSNWSVGQNTYSDENGNFTLYSNDSCTHFEISAPGLSKVKFDRNDLIYNRIDGKTHDFSDLENVKLEYHKINYQPFLKNDTTFFEFKEGLFDKAKFSAEMGTIELKEL